MNKKDLKGYFRKKTLKQKFNSFEEYELFEKKELIKEIRDSAGGEEYLKNIKKDKELITEDLIKDSFSLGQIYFNWVYRKIMTLGSKFVTFEFDDKKLKSEISNFKSKNNRGFHPIWSNLSNNLFYINEDKENQVGFLYYIKGNGKSFFDTKDQNYKTIYFEKILYFNFYLDLGFGEIFSKGCSSGDILHFRRTLEEFGIKISNLNISNQILEKFYEESEQITSKSEETENLKETNSRNRQEADVKEFTRRNGTLYKTNGYFKYGDEDSDKILVQLKKGEDKQFKISRETLLDYKRNEIVKIFINKYLSNLTPKKIIDDSKEAILHLFSNKVNGGILSDNIKPVLNYSVEKLKIKCPKCPETQIIENEKLNKELYCINENCNFVFTPKDKDIIEKFFVINDLIFNKFKEYFMKEFEFGNKKFKFYFSNHYDSNNNSNEISLIFNPYLNLKNDFFKLVNEFNSNYFYVNINYLIEIFEGKKEINELFEKIIKKNAELIKKNELEILEQIRDEFNEKLEKCKSEDSHESELQNFIEKYPIILGINYCHFLPKKTLSNEFITDFVLIHNGDDSSNITFVEIEKVQKEVSKIKDQKSKNVTQEKIQYTPDFKSALEQIKDWRKWLLKPENQLQFQSQIKQKLNSESLKNPHFIQIVGSSKELTPTQKEDLREENDLIKGWNGKIITYDTILYNLNKKIESLKEIKIKN